MNQNSQVNNPNDLKVVSFYNSTDFTFTPEMGCMYDGRPIFGITGAPGINGGETMQLPYHVGHRLATNLAKVVMMRGSNDKPQLDAQGQPIVKALWDEVRLNEIKNSFIKELYSEQKPIAMSETDKLMAKVEEYKKMVEDLVGSKAPETAPEAPTESVNPTPEVIPVAPNSEAPKAYQDKKEVIEELTKRGIKFDARKNKAELEKLLA